MKLAYFPKQCALNSSAPMSAFLRSCQQHGIELMENSLDADAAVIWSVTWAGRMQPNQQVYRYYRQFGRPVIVLEVGALRRGQTWKIAVNNITADGYYGHRENLDQHRLAKLNIAVTKKFKPDPSVLIVAQNNQSLQVEKLKSLDQWITDTVYQLKTHTDRPVIVRPHPRCRLNVLHLSNLVQIQTPKKIINTYDDFDIDYQHHAVINYNSGVGIQAAVSGATVIVDSSSLAYPVASDLPSIEQTKDIDRSQWLLEIAHTEYLIEEIERGLWLPRLAPALPL